MNPNNRSLQAIDPYADFLIQSRGPLSQTDQIKLELCHKIVDFIKARLLLQSFVAEQLKINKSRMSDICLRKIDLFTIDRLAEIYFRLNPKAKIEIH